MNTFLHCVAAPIGLNQRKRKERKKGQETELLLVEQVLALIKVIQIILLEVSDPFSEIFLSLFLSLAYMKGVWDLAVFLFLFSPRVIYGLGFRIMLVQPTSLWKIFD